MGKINFRLIGLIGIINLSLLSMITIWRTIRWYMSWEDSHTFSSFAFRKKLAFHILLILTTTTDLPLYVSFFVIENYSLITYSFHKLSAAFLFAALSITISDWAAVLHDIHEYKKYPWIFRRAGLLTVNGIYSCISFVNFIICYCSTSLDDYTNSPLYVATIFLQILISVLLTCLMLHAGLKLYNRIQGAAGNLDHSNHGAGKKRSLTRPLAPSDSLPHHRNQFASQFDGSAEFRSALRNLNLVMASCTICILIQMIMIILNYAYGYANNSTESLGPCVLFWVLNYWLAAWGPVLSLLYLSRTHSHRKNKARFNTLRIQNSGETDAVLQSPLIDPSSFSTHTLSGDLDRVGIDGGEGRGGREERNSGGVGDGSNNTSAFLSANQNVLQSILSNSTYSPRRSNNNNSARSSQISTRSGHQTNQPPGYASHIDEEGSVQTIEEYVEDGGLSYSILSPDQSMLSHLYAMHSPHSQSATVHRNISGGRDRGQGADEGDEDDKVDGGERAGDMRYKGSIADIRDTTVTLPSELYFTDIIRHAQDFSYRGGEEHNGHYN